MSDQEKYFALYIQEAQELLELLNQNLLALEEDSNNSELQNEIFRVIHTLKSSSAGLGYESLAQLAHVFEDVLWEIKKETILVDSHTMDIMFFTRDNLHAMIMMIADKKQNTVAIDKNVELLQALLLTSQEQELVCSGSKAFIINDEMKKVVDSLKEKGFFLCVFCVTLDSDCFLKTPRMLVVKGTLEELATIIAMQPDLNSLKEECEYDVVRFLVAIETSDKDSIHKTLSSLSDVKVVQIEDFDEGTLSQKALEEEKDNPQEQNLVQRIVSETKTVCNLPLIKVNSEKIDSMINLTEELCISQYRIVQYSAKYNDSFLERSLYRLQKICDQMQYKMLRLRLIPVSQVFGNFPRIVRDLAKQEKKEIHFSIEGAELELDKILLENIAEPMIHLLKNSIDHGIELPAIRKEKGKDEKGMLLVRVYKDSTYAYVEVIDDGAGIDLDVVKKIALEKKLVEETTLALMSDKALNMLVAVPGFSTKDQVTNMSGRGVGVDAVKVVAESFGGEMSIDSTVGKGVKITLKFPEMTSIIQALMVYVGEHLLAVPILAVREIIRIKCDDLVKNDGQYKYTYKGQVITVKKLIRFFDKNITIARGKDSLKDQMCTILILEYADNKKGVMIDGVCGKQSIVVKPLPRVLRVIQLFSGVTMLEDGTLAFVLEPMHLLT